MIFFENSNFCERGYFSVYFLAIFHYNIIKSWDIHGMRPIILGYFIPTCMTVSVERERIFLGIEYHTSAVLLSVLACLIHTYTRPPSINAPSLPQHLPRCYRLSLQINVFGLKYCKNKGIIAITEKNTFKPAASVTTERSNHSTSLDYMGEIENVQVSPQSYVYCQ